MIFISIYNTIVYSILFGPIETVNADLDRYPDGASFSGFMLTQILRYWEKYGKSTFPDPPRRWYFSNIGLSGSVSVD